MKGLRQCFGNSSRLRLGVQVAGSSDYQALKGVNKESELSFMKKEVLDYVIEKTHELMNAASCSSEAKGSGAELAGCGRYRTGSR